LLDLLRKKFNQNSCHYGSVVSVIIIELTCYIFTIISVIRCLSSSANSHLIFAGSSSGYAHCWDLRLVSVVVVRIYYCMDI
jgi:WD40 repeat protein